MVIEINDETTKRLEELAHLEDRSKTAILRRALGLYSALSKDSEEFGPEMTIEIRDKHNKVLRKIKWL